MLRPHIAAIAASLGSLPGAVAADELAFRVSLEAINHDLVEYVAEVGERVRVEVNAGDSLGEVVESHCGGVDPRYLDVLRRHRVEGLPPEIYPDSRFASHGTVDLPSCLRLSSLGYAVERREVEPRNTPYGYYVADGAGFARFAHVDLTASSGAPEHPAYIDVFRMLNPRYASTGVIVAGGEVAVPRSPANAWASFPLAASHSGDHTRYMEQIAALIDASTGGKIEFEDTEEIKLYSQLTEKELQEHGWCQPTSDEADTDLIELANVIAYNVTKLRRDHGVVPRETTIIVADTGLYESANLPFPKLWRQRDGFFPTPPGQVSAMAPWPSQPEHQHGTFVTTRALGGPQFMELASASGLQLRVAALNVFRRKQELCKEQDGIASCPRHRIGADVFNAVAEKASDHGAILNLSVGRHTEFTGLKPYLDSGRALFVVAAGNDGESLSKRKVYPARYGGSEGDGRRNLIAVAALNASGLLAGFSNFGKRYIDIAAPGCLQDVLEFDPERSTFRRARASGTSLSAPAVSFAAALVGSFHRDPTPRHLKQRLLVSADLHPDLEKYVEDGRVLNVVKAAAVFQDVVEAVVDGERRLIRGEIDVNRRLFDFCASELSLVRDPNDGSQVVKKVALRGDGRLRVYWIEEDVLRSETCPVEDFSLVVTDHFTGERYQLETNALRDVVFQETF